MSVADDAAKRISEARQRGESVSVVTSPGATVIVITSAVQSTAPDDLIRLEDAAPIAATSVRTLRDAIKSGELPAFGRQRDRAVRRADLDRWIEGRAVRPHAAIDDADLERRMKRLAGAR